MHLLIKIDAFTDKNLRTDAFTDTVLPFSKTNSFADVSSVYAVSL